MNYSCLAAQPVHTQDDNTQMYLFTYYYYYYSQFNACSNKITFQFTKTLRYKVQWRRKDTNLLWRVQLGRPKMASHRDRSLALQAACFNSFVCPKRNGIIKGGRVWKSE